MKKIIALELDLTTLTETFTTYAAGIWQKTMSVPQLVQDNSPITTIFSGTWTIGVDPIAIGSVRVDNFLLGDVGSKEELIEQDGAFHFDAATQILYIAIYDYAPAWGYKTYKIGETSGFISQAQNQIINGKAYPVSSRLGATPYAPRLVSDVSIDESVDDQKNGIFIYEEIEATINNGDGAYDNIRESVTGNEARVLIAYISESKEEEIETGKPFKIRAESSDFEIVREGIVEDVDYSDPNRPVVRAIDPRADWTQKIGTSLLTVAEYPNLEDKYVDKYKPLLIGQVNGSTCIQLEPKPVSASPIDFLVCDTTVGNIEAVDDIYFDGKISGADVDRVLTGGEYSLNISTGVLTINNYNSGKAYFYGRVSDLTETVEITLYLLNEYANLAYIASNFNYNEIETIRALDYTTHVYIDEKGDKLRDVIQKLISDIQVDFFQQGSVLTMRKSNVERPSVEDVPYWEISDNPAPWVDDRTDTVKTIAIGYNRDYRQDTFDTYYDSSQEQEAIDNNRKAVDKSEVTNLTTRTDVAEIYDEFYDRFVVPSRTITINRLRPFTAMLTDFFTHKVQRILPGSKQPVFERGLYKITAIDQNAGTAEAVYFSDKPEPYISTGRAAGVRNWSTVEDGYTVVGGKAVYADGSYIFPGDTPTIKEGLVITQRSTRTRGHAFGAPNSNRALEPFSGIPAFSRAAFRTPAAQGGLAVGLAPVPSSGNVAGITQQVGE